MYESEFPDHEKEFIQPIIRIQMNNDHGKEIARVTEETGEKVVYRTAKHKECFVI